MIILRRTLMPALVAASCLAPSLAAGQGTRDDYARAERFLNDDIKKLAFDGQVDPHWLRGTDRFWYLNDGPEGKTFMMADAAQGTRAPAFDHQRLAQGLSRASGKTYSARELPFTIIRFNNNTVAFNVARVGYSCDLANYDCSKLKEAIEEETDEARIGPPRQPDPTEMPRTGTAIAGSQPAGVRSRSQSLGAHRCDRGGDPVEQGRRALLRLRDAAAVADGDGGTRHRGCRAISGRVLVARFEQDRHLRDGSAELSAIDHHAVRSPGSIQTEVLQLRLPAAGGLGAADREADGVRHPAPEANRRRCQTAGAAVLRRTDRGVVQRQPPFPVP